MLTCSAVVTNTLVSRGHLVAYCCPHVVISVFNPSSSWRSPLQRILSTNDKGAEIAHVVKAVVAAAWAAVGSPGSAAAAVSISGC